MKPLTFMNLSGDAITSIVNFYKLDPKKDILVLSDDLDMEF
jgi:PTH1 family peptidyl-tRNA hydrolase